MRTVDSMDPNMDIINIPTDLLRDMIVKQQEENKKTEMMILSFGVGIDPSLGMLVRLNVMTNLIIDNLTTLKQGDRVHNMAIIEYLFQQELANAFEQTLSAARRASLAQGNGQGGIILPNPNG